MMKTDQKSPVVAFLLSLLPGFGHLYIGRVFRFLLYAGGFFIPLGILFLVVVSGNGGGGEEFLIALTFSFFFFVINMLDMLITIAKGKHKAFQPSFTSMERDENGQMRPVFDPLAMQEQNEKTKIMMMSIVPGLGHMYMGLLVRGITTMILFVGVFGITLFLATVFSSPSLLVLWLALPVIWMYSMFDALALLSNRQKGEELTDQSLFSNIEGHMADGNKNRITALLLSLLPGVGHLYLGMQQRGLQLMGCFLISIFVMDQLRLTLFLFLLPLLWCYAFFDVLHQLKKWERNELTDEPFIAVFIPYQRWIGLGLLVIGIYYLFDRIAREWLSSYYPDLMQQYYEIKYMLPTIIISFVLVLLGIKLLFGTSRKEKQNGEEEVS